MAAQSFDEHVSAMVKSAMDERGEWATASHLAWVQRMYSRALVRTLELDRREADLARREADLVRREEGASVRAPKKSRRGGKAAHGGGGDLARPDHDGGDEASSA